MEAEKLKTRCVDHGDGMYMLGWRAEASGVYTMHVTIDGLHVVGSPAQLVMTAAKPEVSACEVTGVGLHNDVAGKQAVVRVRLRDRYLNPAKPLPDMKFGLAMLPAEPAQPEDQKEKKAMRLPGEKAPPSSGEDGELVGDGAPRKKDRFDRAGIDMACDGQWIGDEYELRYVAKEAGNFELNVWCMTGEKITSVAAAAQAMLAVESPTFASERQKLPGAPFALHVAEGKAYAAASIMEGDETAQSGSLIAGEKFSLKAQLRDQYNNATDAPSGSLVATLDCPDFEGSEDPMRREHVELPLRAKGGMGEYEVTYEPHIRGLHVVRMKLGGEEISGSPIQLVCMPGPPLASKSRLHPPSTPPVTHQPVTMRVELIDRFGNGVRKGGARVDGRAMGASAGQVAVEDHQDGTYSVTFTANAIGDYKVTVRLENKDELTPITMYIAEGKPIQRAPIAPLTASAPAPAGLKPTNRGLNSPASVSSGPDNAAPASAVAALEAFDLQPPPVELMVQPPAAPQDTLFEKPTFQESAPRPGVSSPQEATPAALDAAVTAAAPPPVVDVTDRADYGTGDAAAGEEDDAEEEEAEGGAESGGKGTPGKPKKAKKKSARGKSPAKSATGKATPAKAGGASSKPAPAAKASPAKPAPAAKASPAKPAPAPKASPAAKTGSRCCKAGSCGEAIARKASSAAKSAKADGAKSSAAKPTPSSRPRRASPMAERVGAAATALARSKKARRRPRRSSPHALSTTRSRRRGRRRLHRRLRDRLRSRVPFRRSPPLLQAMQSPSEAFP